MIISSPLRKIGGLLFLGLLLLLVIIHSFCIWRSAIHYERGQEHFRDGHVLEAAREFQTSIGYYAPLNPFSRKAAEQIAYMVHTLSPEQVLLVGELRDRLQRSLFSIRSFYQPYGDLFDGDSPPVIPNDPRLTLYVLSLLCSLTGFGVWWWPSLPIKTKAAVSTIALSGWALLLYLC